MTRRRWIADECWGDGAALVGAHALHLVRVLRARIGQEFDIAIAGSVRRGRVTVISADEGRVEFELGDEVAASQVSDITLLIAVFKFDRLEWAIEKCTEMGVSRILPMITRRTESHLAKAADKRVDRWRRIAVQASEQSRRASVPIINNPEKFSESLLETDQGCRIVLAESEEQLSLTRALSQRDSDSVSLAVGPEGGWTEDEQRLFSRKGWTAASLGQNILRAETAAVAAIAIVSAEVQE